MKSLLWSAVGALVLGFATAGVAGCGSSNLGGPGGVIPGPDSGTAGGLDATVSGDSGVTPPPLLQDSGTGDAAQQLVISPATVTLTVVVGTAPSIPTQAFTATYGGAPVSAAFTIDKGELGQIGVGTGVFTPAATLGGTATVTATYNSFTATAKLNVKITNVLAGDPNPPDAGAGAGGYGGVGGSGEGVAPPPSQIGTLNGTPTADAALGFLYPYDKTVFPQAILPPLLQWSYGSHSFDGVFIHITESFYEYKGYFTAPATPFQNHPLPQAVWNALAYSNAGEPVTVQLTFSQGTTAFGPITESWLFAQGELKGTIYYNSYGTKLAYNLAGALGPNPYFGGATLAIKEGQTGPVLVAGSSTIMPDAGGNDNGCRVCHSVAAGGSVLVTQHGDNSYVATSAYALTSGNAETALANNNNDGRFTYPAVYPDGTMMLTHESTSALYDLTGAPIPGVTGIPSGLSAFTPAFSPDGAHVAFNFAAGKLPDGGAADQASILSLDFSPTTKAFSNLQELFTPPPGMHAYWPSFLPTSTGGTATSTGVIFQVETVNNGRDTAGTRSQCDKPSAAQGGDGTIQSGNLCHSEGTHGQLWWVDLATHTAAPLEALNGLVGSSSYLPPHPTYTGTSGDDTTLNYEPTVNPVPSGGYAWVVFTSRRLYGNVATINPFWSDPRFEDISSSPTTKKLWVAAIDLNPTPGKDPSHPAFYLPAQELLAGNARGFWVVDPCQKDGTSCLTGDECCGGYCRPGTDGGALTCTATQPSCAQEFEKCTSTGECCGASVGIQCIGGFCSQGAPK
jgi:hypothetical protein